MKPSRKIQEWRKINNDNFYTNNATINRFPFSDEESNSEEESHHKLLLPNKRKTNNTCVLQATLQSSN